MKSYNGRTDLKDTLRLAVVIGGMIGLGLALTHCDPTPAHAEETKASLKVTARVVSETTITTTHLPSVAPVTIETNEPFTETTVDVERADGSLVTIHTFTF